MGAQHCCGCGKCLAGVIQTLQPAGAVGSTASRRTWTSAEIYLTDIHAPMSLEPRALEVLPPTLLLRRVLWHVPLGDSYMVHTKQVLGDGMQGDVHSATHLGSGQRVAVKHLSSQGDMPEEVLLNLRLSHPNICRLLQVFMEADGRIWLCMERCEGGELFAIVAGTSSVTRQDSFLWATESRIAVLVWQMATALHYIHSMGVVHRDIKLENWMFASPAQERIKLIDFGLSTSFIDVQASIASAGISYRQLRHACGSCYCLAPEVVKYCDGQLVQGEGYGCKVDIWALGILLFMLVSGTAPFDATSEVGVIKRIATLQAIDVSDALFSGLRWHFVSDECKDLILKCLSIDQSRRLTAAGVQLHPWLASSVKARGTHPRSLATIMQDLRIAGCRMRASAVLAPICGYLACTIYLAPGLWTTLKADFLALEGLPARAPRGSLAVERLLHVCPNGHGMGKSSNHVSQAWMCFCDFLFDVMFSGKTVFVDYCSYPGTSLDHVPCEGKLD
eukprot:TRINITY_DN105337_c0_g1_i1.p1 TRINITY_DN105337_c0_g1~~TRINITY_DN105337_c0_g1_i1.p1  ORF type:complete len:523 (+),score=58.99 TRINITY_DN105337_c0_g1_i1:60-1571(+)